MVAMIVVLVFPPKESWSILVSLLSLYGTCWFSVKAVMTRPNVKSDVLIQPASLFRSLVAPDLPTFSEPAKSTRFSFPIFKREEPSKEESRVWIVMVKIQWDRLWVSTSKFKNKLPRCFVEFSFCNISLFQSLVENFKDILSGWYRNFF